jgi:hypothetical protein
MAIRIVVGATLLLIGLVWFFQGIGAIEGYGMTGHAEWSVIGAVLIVLAVGLLAGARKRRDPE